MLKKHIDRLQNSRKILVPYNSMKHINGIVIEKNSQGKIEVTWIDSYNKYFRETRSEEFKKAFKEIAPEFDFKFDESADQQDEGFSCGPRTMANFKSIIEGKSLNKKQDVSKIRQNHMTFINSKESIQNEIKNDSHVNNIATSTAITVRDKIFDKLSIVVGENYSNKVKHNIVKYGSLANSYFCYNFYREITNNPVQTLISIANLALTSAFYIPHIINSNVIFSSIICPVAIYATYNISSYSSDLASSYIKNNDKIPEIKPIIAEVIKKINIPRYKKTSCTKF